MSLLAVRTINTISIKSNALAVFLTSTRFCLAHKYRLVFDSLEDVQQVLPVLPCLPLQESPKCQMSTSHSVDQLAPWPLTVEQSQHQQLMPALTLIVRQLSLGSFYKSHLNTALFLLPLRCYEASMQVFFQLVCHSTDNVETTSH